MPSLLSGEVIREFRKRRKMSQYELQDAQERHATDDDDTQHSPGTSTLHRQMNSLELKVKDYFYPFIYGLQPEAAQLYDKLLFLADHAREYPGALEEAKQAYAQMETIVPPEGLKRQIMISCQVRILEAENADPGKIIDLTNKGISITYPEFNRDDFDSSMLLFEEPYLLHAEARAIARAREPNKAIARLQQIEKGLSWLPQEDKIKERQLTPILLSLSRLLLDAGRYQEALAACEKGNKLSITRNKGRYTPDFTYLKAQILTKMGDHKDCFKLLTYAFFGFTMMRKHRQAAQVREYAQSLRLTIETYGVEHLPAAMPDLTFDYGSKVRAKTMGGLIRTLRMEVGLSQTAICKGICDRSVLCRIERSEIKNSLYYVEAMFQRLGRDMDKYFDTFLSKSEFDGKQMRDKVRMLKVNRRYDEAKKLLEELKQWEDYDKNINLQFIRYNEAELYAKTEGRNATHFQMLKDALSITREDLLELRGDIIEDFRLTNYEIIILNQIGNYLCENGEYTHGLDIFDSLIKSVRENYLDESERIKTLLLLLYNYSNYLGHNKQYNEAEKYANEGEDLCVKHCHCIRMPGFLANKADALIEKGMNEKGIPYLALSYYGYAMLENMGEAKKMCDHAKERLNLCFTSFDEDL